MHYQLLFFQEKKQVVVELPESLASEQDEEIVAHESYVFKAPIAPATPRIFILSASLSVEIETPSSVSVQPQPVAAQVVVASSSKVVQDVAPVAKQQEEVSEPIQQPPSSPLSPPSPTPPTPVGEVAPQQQADPSGLPNNPPSGDLSKSLPLDSGNVVVDPKDAER